MPTFSVGYLYYRGCWVGIATPYREWQDSPSNGKHIVLSGLEDDDLFGRILTSRELIEFSVWTVS